MRPQKSIRKTDSFFFEKAIVIPILVLSTLLTSIITLMKRPLFNSETFRETLRTFLACVFAIFIWILGLLFCCSCSRSSFLFHGDGEIDYYYKGASGPSPLEMPMHNAPVLPADPLHFNS